MEIKAIETVYKGYRFRSRTEAKWAVFLDCLCIDWEYEREGYVLPSGYYLPDFYLPNEGIWIEIKGSPPIEAEMTLAYELSAGLKQVVFIQSGQPGIEPFADDYWRPTGSLDAFAGECWDTWPTPSLGMALWEYNFQDCCLPEFIHEKFPGAEIQADDSPQRRRLLIELDRRYYFAKYGKPHPHWMFGRREYGTSPGLMWGIDEGKLRTAIGWTVSETVAEALSIARQARFEHGEQPIISATGAYA